jgi:hypothetical protein
MLPPLGISLFSALMLIASSSAAVLTYKAACTGAAVVPSITSKATGSVSITLINKTHARGYFFATNINQMTMAHLHVGAVGKNGPPIAWAFDGTYGPISGSVKATFTFDPSVNNISSLLAAGQVYFNIHTTVYPAGELRCQISPSAPSPSFPPPPAIVDPQACNVTNKGPDYPGHAFAPIPGSGVIARDIKFAMNCFNSIRINRTLAVEHVSALAAYYKEYYIFHDIAKNPGDPTATPFSPFPSGLNASVFAGKEDLESDFQALIQSFDPSFDTVGLGSLYFGINRIVAGLRDAHVTNGLPGSFGGLLDEGEAYFAFVQVINGSPVFPTLTMNRDGHVFDYVANKTIATINGTSLVNFSANIFTSKSYASAFKSLGAVLNRFLKQTLTASPSFGFRFKLVELSNPLDFFNKTYLIKYTGWFWPDSSSLSINLHYYFSQMALLLSGFLRLSLEAPPSSILGAHLRSSLLSPTSLDQATLPSRLLRMSTLVTCPLYLLSPLQTPRMIASLMLLPPSAALCSRQVST